jgi:16S rRNA (guanine527-N7)-methyltransferase
VGTSDPHVRAWVVAILNRARAQGFLGPGGVEAHVEHALGFADAVAQVRGQPLGAEDRVADLGPGGGIPGLVLAAEFPRTQFSLIEGSVRRAALLMAAVKELGWEARVSVVGARAEDVGREHHWRKQHTVVVARQFGPPGVTAECGSPLLEVGGLLVVSEPPGSTGDRWVQEGLTALGLRRERTLEGFVVLVQEVPCPERYPRRVGVPAKRPLF